jgi:16S rRNA (cytidine1402-2'-O)-methyltransferase
MAKQPPLGRLYLVPAPLDFACNDLVNLQNTMPMGTLEIASRLQYWISENAKSARGYLKRVNEIVPDPGSSVVRAAHDLGMEVVPLTGPVSLLLALAASGLNGQSFAFVGYLPQDAADRAARVRELESLALKTGQTQLFIETPYRNAAMMQTLLQTLQHNTRLAVCSGLTLSRGACQSDTIKNWKKRTAVVDNATPAVFALGR